MNKKALVSVVSTSLIIVVTVASVIAFQTWYSQYSSGLLSKTEGDVSGSNSNKVEIFSVIDDKIYVKSYKNSTLEKIKIGEKECNTQFPLTEGVNELDLAPCLDEYTGKKEISIYGTSQILSYSYYSKTKNIDCDNLEGEWILVSGNDELGTKDFCVMKYEAKWNGSGVLADQNNMYCGNGDDNGANNCDTSNVGITSSPKYKPLTRVTHLEAQALCEKYGYNLITDKQWVTISRNIESVNRNWIGNSLYIGHSDGNPGSMINASTDDDPYYRTSNPNTNQKRVLYLSNGEAIWDLAGNAWEWTNDSFQNNSESSLGMGSSNWYEWNQISGYEDLRSKNLLLNSSNGIGIVYADIDNAYPSTSIHSFIRGGSYNFASNSGIYSLSLNKGPTMSVDDVGFRCAYS